MFVSYYHIASIAHKKRLIDGEGHQPRAIIYSRFLEALGLAQSSNLGLHPLFFCCLAVRPQTGSFLIDHNGAPQKTVKKTKALHTFHSDRDWHSIGWFHWPSGQLMVSCI